MISYIIVAMVSGCIGFMVATMLFASKISDYQVNKLNKGEFN